MLVVSLALRVIVVGLLGWLAVVDVRTRRLPTTGVVAIATLFFADSVLTRMPPTEMLVHAGVALFILLVGAALFAARMLGGGDAKLASAIFLWTGAAGFIPALTLISVIGLLVSLVSLATRRMDPAQHRGMLAVLALFSSGRGVPYGVALAAGGGVVIVLPALVPLLVVR